MSRPATITFNEACRYLMLTSKELMSYIDAGMPYSHKRGGFCFDKADIQNWLRDDNVDFAAL